MWWLIPGKFEMERDELADPKLVAAHEAGHAVLAYYHGEAIGPSAVVAWGPRRFAGRHRHGPPSGVVDAGSHWPRAAERLLAGDLAARLVGGLPARRVSVPLRGVAIGPRTNPADVIHWLLTDDERNAKHDVAKVFAGIKEYGPAGRSWRGRFNWWPWLWRRQRAARSVLSSKAAEPALHAVADLLLSKLGRDVDGDTVFATLRARGAPIRDSTFPPCVLR